jgi:curved DNA-binding protein CbpA
VGLEFLPASAKLTMEENHYKTLGVPPDADEKEIRSAYRNLAKKFHPDAGKASSAEEFHAVQGAYEVLSDPEKRRQYDLERARQVEDIPLRGTWHGGFDFESRRGFPTHLDLRSLASSRRAEPISVSLSRNRHLPWNDPFEDFDALFRRLLEDFLF